MKREDVALEDSWDLQPLYANLEKWEEEFALEASSERFRRLEEQKGNIAKTPKTLALFLESYFDIDRTLNKLYTYAHLKHDEDIANEQYKKIESMAKTSLHEFAEATSAAKERSARL